VSEGFDVPSVVAAIMLRPTQSEGLYLQQVGRALRPAPGKASAYVLDHAGNVARHGLPQDPREWTLDGRRRRDEAPALQQCPSCFAMLPRAMQQCPECECDLSVAARAAGGGNTRGVEQREGELIKLTPELIARHRAERAREQGAARSREDLMRLAQQRGYSPRWVDHILASRARREGNS
jgi:superfamily II DNA or RNA helicase